MGKTARHWGEKMNLKEAAQQALEALEEYQQKGAPFMSCDAAVDALRAALNQERYVVTGNEFHGAPPEPYANWGDAIAAMIDRGVIQGLRISALAEDLSADTGKTSYYMADASKLVATIRQEVTVEPVAWRYTPSERLRDVVLTSDPSQARLAADYGCEVQPLYLAPPQRPAEPVGEVTEAVGGAFKCEFFKYLPVGTKLYTAPPKREPLTDAEIGAVAADIWGSILIAPQSYQQFARAIERAHGIGGEE